MKKAIWIILSIFVLFPLMVVGGCYGVVKYQYRDTFMPGLFVNGFYISDHTPAEVNEELKKDTICPEYTVTDKDGNVYSFSLEEIQYEQDYLKQLEQIHKEQSVIRFFQWLFGEEVSFEDQNLQPETSYDTKTLRDYLDHAEYLADNSDPKDKIVEIRKDKSGYYLYDETKNLLSHEKAVTAIEENLNNGIFEIDLYEQGCYIEVDHTSQMKEAVKMWESLAQYVESTVTYEFGDRTEFIDGSVISDFIAVDENGEFLFDESGSFYLDEKKVKEYVASLAEKYNTVNKPRKFHTTRGDTVIVETGTYGVKLDEKAELEYLMNVIGRKAQVTRTPELSQNSFTNIYNTDDIGNTYIEVDLTNQTMYYYKKGNKIIETPVVTGNTSLGRGTPQKVCFVYAKQRNRILRGEDYATPVSYWMPVYGGVGIHDANWRGKFGGTIYKTNGSHGCINTPIKVVSKLYEMVEIGTPVIIFY